MTHPDTHPDTYPDTRLFIDNQWRDAADGRSLAVIDPATGREIGRVAHAGRVDLEAALAAAQRGFAKYLNNLIEQDHRAVKRIGRPMLGFKSFRCARAAITGIETMHMIKKNQLGGLKERASPAANQFYSLAF